MGNKTSSDKGNFFGPGDAMERLVRNKCNNGIQFLTGGRSTSCPDDSKNRLKILKSVRPVCHTRMTVFRGQ